VVAGTENHNDRIVRRLIGVVRLLKLNTWSHIDISKVGIEGCYGGGSTRLSRRDVMVQENTEHAHHKRTAHRGWQVSKLTQLARPINRWKMEPFVIHSHLCMARGLKGGHHIIDRLVKGHSPLCKLDRACPPKVDNGVQRLEHHRVQFVPEERRR
jgi:hypothetical protein